MTICAVNTQLLSSTMYKSNLEFSIMNISNKRQTIAYQVTNLVGCDTEDPAYIKLQWMDQQLELQQKQLETQQKAVTAQIESYQKLLDNNIKKDFTINLVG